MLAVAGACMETFFIWQDLFTKFGMDYFLKQRYNLRTYLTYMHSIIRKGFFQNFIKISQWELGSTYSISVGMNNCSLILAILLY